MLRYGIHWTSRHLGTRERQQDRNNRWEYRGPNDKLITLTATAWNRNELTAEEETCMSAHRNFVLDFFANLAFPFSSGSISLANYITIKSEQDTSSDVSRFKDMEAIVIPMNFWHLMSPYTYTVKSCLNIYHEICWGRGLCDLTVTSCADLYLYFWTVISTC